MRHAVLLVWQLEGFRYRVEDVKRAVTRVAVREARLAEIKQEVRVVPLAPTTRHDIRVHVTSP
jgi:hypothetical protein